MAISQSVRLPALIGESGLEIRFPDGDRPLSQDQEWCEVQIDGTWRRIRLHDYNELYLVPGLYESVFYRTLKCNSPIRVVGLLQEVLADTTTRAEDLRVLDVGAGNGMVGYALHEADVRTVVGVDIIPEAKMAAERDNPWCYDEYHVLDLTEMPAEAEERIRSLRLNAMTCVAALGFGDIPAKAFLKAVDLLETPAHLAFNIKEDFVQEKDSTGFDKVIRSLARQEIIRIDAYRRYRHRFSSSNEPLHYIAMVATKQKDIPAGFFETAWE